MKVLFSLAVLALIATVVICAPAGQNPPPPMPLQPPPPQMMDKRQSYYQQQQQMPYGNNGYYRDNSREDWSPEDAYKYQMRYNNPNGYNQVNPYNTQQYNPSNGMNGMGMGYNSGYRGNSGSNQYPYNSQSQGYYQG